MSNPTTREKLREEFYEWLETQGAIPEKVIADFWLDKLEQECALRGISTREKKQGDNPCADCGTKENPVWFCDNVLWNIIMNDDKTGNEERGKIICPACFMKRAEQKFEVMAWRLIPEFKWQPLPPATEGDKEN